MEKSFAEIMLTPDLLAMLGNKEQFDLAQKESLGQDEDGSEVFPPKEVEDDMMVGADGISDR